MLTTSTQQNRFIERPSIAPFITCTVHTKYYPKSSVSLQFGRRNFQYEKILGVFNLGISWLYRNYRKSKHTENFPNYSISRIGSIQKKYCETMFEGGVGQLSETLMWLVACLWADKQTNKDSLPLLQILCRTMGLCYKSMHGYKKDCTKNNLKKTLIIASGLQILRP